MKGGAVKQFCQKNFCARNPTDIIFKRTFSLIKNQDFSIYLNTIFYFTSIHEKYYQEYNKNYSEVIMAVEIKEFTHEFDTSVSAISLHNVLNVWSSAFEEKLKWLLTRLLGHTCVSFKISGIVTYSIISHNILGSHANSWYTTRLAVLRTGILTMLVLVLTTKRN